MSRASSAWLGVVLLTLALHLAFLGQDTRLPSDLGQYFVPLPALYGAMQGGPGEGVWDALISRPGAWYNLLCALWLSVVGKSSAAFQMLDLISFAALLFIGSSVGKQLGGEGVGGERARLAFASVLCALPMVVLSARTSWVHVPEATLLLAMLRLWIGDPTLSKRRSIAGLSALGALAIGLRPSALPWLALLSSAMLWGIEGQRARWRSLAWILGIWALSCLQMLPYLETYLAAKAMARARYLERVPELLPQLVGAVGVLGGLASVAVGVLSLRKPDGLVALAWAFVGVSLLLTLSSGAGVDNFLPLALGLAILAALATRRRPWTVGIWALPLLGLTLPQLSTELPKDGALSRVFGALRIPAHPGPNNRLRPFEDLAADEVIQLIEASCPDSSDPCTILVDQGLFSPYGESLGELPLFLGSYLRPSLVSLARDELPEDLEPDALVHWSCTSPEQLEEERIWRSRYPQSGRKLMSLSETHELRLVWQRPIRSCTLMYLAPGGRVADMERLPFPGAVQESLRQPLNLSGISGGHRDRPRPQVPGR